MIAEPIDINEEPIGDWFFTLYGPANSLGAPTDGARLMEESVEHTTAGQRERIQWFQFLLHAVHLVFQHFDLAIAHPMHALVFGFRRGGEFAANIKEFILDAPQHLCVPRVVVTESVTVIRQISPDDSDRGIQFVNSTISLQAAGFLGHAPATD
jgi:hypothetical protein